MSKTVFTGYMIYSNGRRVSNYLYHYKESAENEIKHMGHTTAYVVKLKVEGELDHD